ncbi:MAG: Indole-3-glycerol-phosphate synthase [Fibrobacteres bacterium]|nr:Indole-3-glycerol-phosphate synthase [Fibrobacterota bacterium]
MAINILDKIIKAKAVRLAELKGAVSPADIEAKARSLPPPALDFLAALTAPKTSATGGPGIHVIAEVKKASPSRGVIREDFKPLDIAKGYLAGGASALSVLTEEDHFQGQDRYLRDISRNVKLPTLRKDFIVDPYQIFEAKVLGASAYLLIVACLKPKQLADMIALGAELNLTPLVEAHTEDEVKIAVDAGSPIIGINNRDLKTFHTSLETTYKLRPLIPAGTPVVSESGIFRKEDLQALAAAGIQAALIGESLIKQKDVTSALKELLSF